jgi:hypothetical protein
MPKRVKVVHVHDDATHADITEAITENGNVENEPVEDVKAEEVSEPEPPPKPKARAKRVSNQKMLKHLKGLLIRNLSRKHPHKMKPSRNERLKLK